MKWYTIAPINLAYNSRNVRLTKELDLGSGVSFTYVPSWLNKLDGLNDLGIHNKELLEEAMYILKLEYEASSMGDPDPEWKGRKSRSKQHNALEKLQIANFSLWLIKPSWIGFKMILHVAENVNYRSWRGFRSTALLLPNDKDTSNYLEIADFEKACKVNIALQQLDRKSCVWIAVRTLWSALTSEHWEVRLLFFWVALEALFGTSTEITHRISHRIAFFLSSSRGEAEKLYKQAKISYRWRSQAVHGMKLGRSGQKREESKEVLYNAETFARKALLKILKDSKSIGSFSSNKSREEYLDGLIFSDLSE